MTLRDGRPDIVHLQVDTSSPVPPYEQIRAQLQVMVTSGALPEGTRLPPIRQLAGDLGLATNTVGRAYHELELEGLVETRGRHGTVVRPPAILDAPERKVVVEQAAEAFALEVQHHGAGLDDALAAVRHAFRRLREGGAPIPSSIPTSIPTNEAAT
jgi:DNA-binding transcriptional regulator YhcF (GntR family)